MENKNPAGPVVPTSGSTWRTRIGRLEERVQRMESTNFDVEEDPVPPAKTKMDELEHRIAHLERIMVHLTMAQLYAEDDPFARPRPPIHKRKA